MTNKNLIQKFKDKQRKLKTELGDYFYSDIDPIFYILLYNKIYKINITENDLFELIKNCDLNQTYPLQDNSKPLTLLIEKQEFSQLPCSHRIFDYAIKNTNMKQDYGTTVLEAFLKSNQVKPVNSTFKPINLTEEQIQIIFDESDLYNYSKENETYIFLEIIHQFNKTKKISEKQFKKIIDQIPPDKKLLKMIIPELLEIKNPPLTTKNWDFLISNSAPFEDFFHVNKIAELIVEKTNSKDNPIPPELNPEIINKLFKKLKLSVVFSDEILNHITTYTQYFDIKNNYLNINNNLDTTNQQIINNPNKPKI
jgi:hypothetical protein